MSASDKHGDYSDTAIATFIEAQKQKELEFLANGQPTLPHPDKILTDDNNPRIVQQVLFKVLGNMESNQKDKDNKRIDVHLEGNNNESTRQAVSQVNMISGTSPTDQVMDIDDTVTVKQHAQSEHGELNLECPSLQPFEEPGSSEAGSTGHIHPSPSADDVLINHSSDTSDSSVFLSSSELNVQRRTPKRSQVCVTRTVSINIEIPFKKSTESEKIVNGDLDDDEGAGTLSYAITRKYLSNLMMFSDEDACVTTNVMIVAVPRTPSLPATLVLNDCDISLIGNLKEIESMFHVVRELDLAQNKITDLCEVQKIMNSMQRLTFLNLSSNDLSHSTNFPTHSVTMKTMKWLVLNGTHIPWDAVEILLSVMPNLEELYLSLNGYTCVDLNDTKALPSVHLVHISGNAIDSWDDIQTLGHKFPNLDTLVMTDCFISGFRNEDNIGAAFEKLQSLNISNNRIETWEEIDKLLNFPALIDLRLLGLPLFEEYTDQQRRQLMIGRLPNMERLNGSQISDQEREDAERAFIRYYMELQRKDRPRRYSQLVKKHGKLDPLVNVDLRPKTVVQVLVKYEEKRDIRSVNVYQTVASLKASLQDFSGLGPSRMRVFYIDKELEGLQGPEELRLNSKMLYTYNLQDGDEFHIDRKGFV